MKKWIYILILIFSVPVKAQINQDSLLKIWNNPNELDSNRLIAIEKISKDVFMFTNPDSSYYYAMLQLNFAKQKKLKKHVSAAFYTIGVSKYFLSEFDSALFFYNQSLVLDQQTNNKQGVVNDLNNIALVHKEKGEFELALKYNFLSLSIKKEIGDTKGMASSYNNLGQIFQEQGDYAKAITNYTKSLKIKEGLQDKSGIAKTLNNIGTLYWLQLDMDRAIEYYLKSLTILEELNDQYNMAGVFQNIGNIYDDKNQHEKALEYHFKCLKINEAIGNRYGVANTYNNIGVIYKNVGQYSKAIDYYNKSVQIKQEIGDKQGLSLSLNNIGDVYRETKNYYKAIEYGNKALFIAKEIEGIVQMRDASNALYDSYKLSGNTSMALKMYEMYVVLNDSIERQENKKELIRQEYKYNYEKKAAADSVVFAKEQELKEAEIRKQKAEIKVKRNQQYGLFGGLALVIIFSMFMYNRYTVTRKQKTIIELQKNEVEEKKIEAEYQRHLVEVKNKEITDSIVYAKRIQAAILPSDNEVKKYLLNSFVLYKPKDIVAGDFYWLEKVGDIILIAAADCTGHGVPGAMVSVVCSNALNRAVREHKLMMPSQILDKTREIVIEEFEKSDEEVKDGMDISLCSINLQTKELCWAGANTPLWIVRNGMLFETKADKQPIGKYSDASPFTSHRFEIQKNDIIYLFTDGLQDQFGGEKGKKLKTAKLRELMLSVYPLEMEKQKELIDISFEKWKGKIEQVDDVCIIGIKI